MIKNILKKKKINSSLLLFLFSVIVLNTYILINIHLKESKKENIFRLHVVANSNSLKDQITKLKVETEVEKYLNSIHYTNHDHIYDILNSNASHILEISNHILRQENLNYSSKLDIGKIYYDEKESMQYDMEKGTYNSARIILGDGDGKNIWTIIFPNKDTIKSIETLDTVLPGIKNLFEQEELEDENIEYDFKIKEIFKDIQKHLNL
ncbi:MAG: stage II sporulation protein R [Clostridia bacterium]|nr:stage II sporulation protein R [Clostridia bacterium]